MLASLLLAAPASAEAPTGSIVIRATAPANAAAASFSFAVSCTGEGAPIERAVVVPTSAGGGTATVDGIPLEMACLVTDSAAPGWRVESTNPQAVVASAEGAPVEFAHSSPAPAAISVVKTATPLGALTSASTPPEVSPGTAITYLLTYRNDGEVAGTAVLTDEIPAGTTYAGKAVCSPACRIAPTVRGGRVTFSVTADPGGTGTVQYTVRVAGDAADGDVIGSNATAKPGAAASNAVLHRVVVPTNGLSVTGRADKDTAPERDVVTYSVDVANRGSAPQDGITVTDAIPANAEYVDGSATCEAPCTAAYDAARSTVTWQVGSLAGGERLAGLRFQARIRPLTPNPDGSLPGVIVLNSAVASSTVTPATRSNEVKTIVVAVLGSKTSAGQAPTKVSKPASSPASAPTLPATGYPTGALLATGLLLVAAGAAMLGGERRWSSSRA